MNNIIAIGNEEDAKGESVAETAHHLGIFNGANRQNSAPRSVPIVHDSNNRCASISKVL